MRRTLSSSLTFLHKVVIPVIWLTMWSVFTIAAFLPGSDVPYATRFFLLIMLFFIAAMMYWFEMRMKVVSINEDHLYASNYKKEIAISLDEIYDVTESKWGNPRTVTIHLRSPSEFGDKVVFIPKTELFLFFKDHPIATELRELIAKRSGATRFGY